MACHGERPPDLRPPVVRLAWRRNGRPRGSVSCQSFAPAVLERWCPPPIRGGSSGKGGLPMARTPTLVLPAYLLLLSSLLRTPARARLRSRPPVPPVPGCILPRPVAKRSVHYQEVYS